MPYTDGRACVEFESGVVEVDRLSRGSSLFPSFSFLILIPCTKLFARFSLCSSLLFLSRLSSCPPPQVSLVRRVLLLTLFLHPKLIFLCVFCCLSGSRSSRASPTSNQGSLGRLASVDRRSRRQDHGPPSVARGSRRSSSSQSRRTLPVHRT